MKKLYKVTIETEIVVYAEDEFKAEDIAIENVKDHVNYGNASIHTNNILSKKDIPYCWDENSLPYISYSYDLKDETIGEILEKK